MSKDSSAKYYKKNKESLQEKVLEKYQDLSEEEKSKKQQYGSKRYKNLPEGEKQKLVKYRKKYYETPKNENTSQIKT